MLTVPLALALLGTSAPAASGTRLDSGLRGRVVIDNCAGPQRADDDCGRPYDARLKIRRVSTGRIVARVRSGDDGRFVVGLNPGRYKVIPVSFAPYPRAEPQRVVIRQGCIKRIVIRYESGLA